MTNNAKPEYETLTANILTLIGLEFVCVPAGEFLMGSKNDNRLAFDNEYPQRQVEIPYDYCIGKYPVTSEQFDQFATSTRYRSYLYDWQKPNHPAVCVSWHDATAYCQWLNDILRGRVELKDLTLRLPTEAEWEKAARGTQGNEWPWGNAFDKNKCNSSEGGKGGTTPVGAYSPRGDSPYGATDMAGNVWEWSLGQMHPTVDERVLRGGAFDHVLYEARCAWRSNLPPDWRNEHTGFRVVVAPGLG
jgi:formylglycine-generating enzyme required for sulfatase activity